VCADVAQGVALGRRHCRVATRSEQRISERDVERSDGLVMFERKKVSTTRPFERLADPPRILARLIRRTGPVVALDERFAIERSEFDVMPKEGHAFDESFRSIPASSRVKVVLFSCGTTPLLCVCSFVICPAVFVVATNINHGLLAAAQARVAREGARVF
jgi:hypothetical protein